MAITTTMRTQVAQLYVSLFGRAPESAGLGYWVNELGNNGKTVAQIAQSMYDVDAARAFYPLSLTNQEIVGKFYTNVLGRTADADGLAYWTAKLDGGETKGKLISEMITAVSAYTGSDAAALTSQSLFNNKVTVGLYYGFTVGGTSTTNTVLAGVSDAAASVTAAQTAIDAAATPATTFTLTTGIDNKIGGTGSDSFDGSLISGVQTLGSADVLNGGAGTDTLVATLLAGTVTPSLTAIETLSLTAGANGAILDLATSTGYTTLENTGSATGNLLSFTNIGSTTPALKYSNGAGGATFAYTAAAVGGAADSATLTLSNVSAGTVTIAGVETVNLVSTGASNTIDASAIAARTLNVSGAQNTALGTLNVATTVVDASALTGTLSATLGAVVGATVTGSQGADTLTISAATGNVVVNTGAGNDNIIAATNLTVTDTIDGGAGTADKLTTTNTIANVLDGATPTTTKISNIEQIAVTDALDGTLILANISSAIDTVNLTVTGGSIMTGGDFITANATSLAVNLGGAAAGNTAGALAGALTVASSGTGTTDALTISNKAINSTTTLNIDVFANQSITSTGYEAVTLNTGAVASGAAQTTATITINADTAATPTSYTVTGTNALTTTSLVTNSTGLLTVNASGMTAQATGTNTLTISGTTSGTAGTQNITGSDGDDIITIGNFVATISGGLGNDSITGGAVVASNISGGDGNDTLIGGALNDIISGGAGNDSITSGAGVDNLSGGDGNDIFVLAGNLTAADSIDGGAGTNTLSITAGTSTSSTQFTNVTNIQQVALTGTGTVTLAAPLSATATTFDLSSAEATTLVLAAGYTGATTVLETNGTASNGTNVDVITNTANVALTVSGKVADLNTVQITGGTGTDALVLTADSGSADLTSTSGIETITLVAGATATATAVLSNAVVATTKTLTVDASAMTNAAATFGFSGKASQLGGVNVTGAAAAVNTITLTNFAGANSVTGGSGADSITSGTGVDSLAGGAGNDAYIFATTLLNTDTVSDSAGAADTLDATINGLTATTGALNISGVEQLNLQTVTAASVINAAGIVGATRINVSDAQNVTFTNLAAGTNLGLGTLATGGQAASSVYTGTLTFGLANATGAADAITVTLANVADGGVNATLVAAAGIETVTLATSTAALAAATLNIAGVVAPTIAVTGGKTAKTVALGTLNAATTALNAGAFLGQLTVTGSATATTFTVAGAEAQNITGGAGNDTVTISTVGTAVQTVAGGTGTDTLNMTLNATTFSMASVSAVENINLTLGSNSAHSPGTAVGGFNDSVLVNITLNGGNSLSTFTAGTAIGSGAAFKSFNASALTGVVDVTIAEGGMNLGDSITGGAATTDVLRYTDAGTANTAVTLSGFEKLVVTTATADSGIALDNATGLTSVEVNGTMNYAITGLAAGVAVGVGNAATALSDAKGVSVALASATGAADALTFNLTKTGGVSGTTLTANGIETLTLNESATVAATAMGLLIRDTNATNAVNINVTGGIAGTIGGVQDVTFLSTALESNVATVNASTFAGNLIMADGSRTGTAAMTITGGTGIDTVIMKHANDVLDGGTGVDTLKIVQTAVLGGFLVDLSSTTDQVTTYNGAANAAVQKGFENADLSGIAGNFGADITARAAGSIITGTANADVITGGAGADVITGGAGADVITGGAGNDVFVYSGTAELVGTNAMVDLVDGGAGTTDAIRLTGATTVAATDLMARITNVEQITASATTGVISITATAAAGTFTGTAFNTIDLSGDTNTTGDNVVSVTGITGITAIIGSAGNDTITIGAAAVANTITGGLGADVLSLGATLASTVVVGTLDTGATYATADKITGFTTTVDKLSLGVAGTTANFATANGAATFAAAVTAANLAMDTTVKYYLATAIVADLGGGAGLESLLFIDADMNGTFDSVIALVGIAGVVVAGDIIA